MRGQALFSILCFCMLFRFNNASINVYGVMSVESASEKSDFCLVYFKEFATIPTEESKAESFPLELESSADWCYVDQDVDPNDKVVLLTSGNCSIPLQAYNVQRKGAKAVFFLINSGVPANVDLNDTMSEEINITVGLISRNSGDHIMAMKDPKTAKLFAPDDDGVHLSLWIILALAVFNVAVGAWWSGHLRFSLYYQEMQGANEAFPNKPSMQVHSLEKSALPIPSCFVVLAVIMMGLMLVALYFFLDKMIYFILVMFLLASIVGVYCGFEPLFLKMPEKYLTTLIRFGARVFCIDFRRLLLFSIAAALGICWFVYRKNKNIWILQNFLGICFNIHMLKMVRLPNLKICTILLVLLFFYDIFFVFITPYFTAAGDSIMERVATGATGGGSGLQERVNHDIERIPMLLVVPQFSFSKINVCLRSESMLGYGDILVPGMLMSYCHMFDLVTSKKKWYFILTLVSYTAGMLVTFVGLLLMKSAQPALLYLVPCTLLPVVLMGWYRGELALLWKGFQAAPLPASVDPQTSDPEAIAEPDVETSPRTNAGSSVVNEKNSLLQ